MANINGSDGNGNSGARNTNLVLGAIGGLSIATIISVANVFIKPLENLINTNRNAIANHIANTDSKNTELRNYIDARIIDLTKKEEADIKLLHRRVTEEAEKIDKLIEVKTDDRFTVKDFEREIARRDDKLHAIDQSVKSMHNDLRKINDNQIRCCLRGIDK